MFACFDSLLFYGFITCRWICELEMVLECPIMQKGIEIVTELRLCSIQEVSVAVND